MIYLADRKVPFSAGHQLPEVIVLRVETDHGSEAAHAAEELAYAVSWHRGLPQAQEHRRYKKPEKWALTATNEHGLR